MANITINDLEMNQDLDAAALKNIMGGRWVYRTHYRRHTVRYTRRYTRYYRRTIYYRRTYYRSYYRTYWSRSTRRVWV